MDEWNKDYRTDCAVLINIAFPDFENYTDCLHYWKVYTEVVRDKKLQGKKIEREENDT